MKRLNLPTIISNEERSPSAGLPAGEHGLTTQPSGSQSVQPAEVIKRDPQENLERAVSRLRDCGISVTHTVTGSRFPKEGGWEPVMSLKVKLDNTADIEAAGTILSGLSAPAKRDDLIMWLTECALMTVSQKDDEQTSELKLKIYAEKLAAYPGDIVRHLLKEWPERSKWFPTWAELKKEADALMGIRPAIVREVRRKSLQIEGPKS